MSQTARGMTPHSGWLSHVAGFAGCLVNAGFAGCLLNAGFAGRLLNAGFAGSPVSTGGGVSTPSGGVVFAPSGCSGSFRSAHRRAAGQVRPTQTRNATKACVAGGRAEHALLRAAQLCRLAAHHQATCKRGKCQAA